MTQPETQQEDRGVQVDPNEILTWIKYNHADVFAAAAAAVVANQKEVAEAVQRAMGVSPQKKTPAKQPVKKTARTGGTKKR